MAKAKKVKEVRPELAGGQGDMVTNQVVQDTPEVVQDTPPEQGELFERWH